MSTLPKPAPQALPEPRSVPPLHNGDHLTSEEFERRYEAMPQLKKAELIEGVVYVPSPVTFDHHGRPHFELIGWLYLYCGSTPGVAGGDNATLRLDLGNEPQPDACLIVRPAHGGRVWIDDEGYIVGAPELVAEVAATSANYDLHVKLSAYRRNGVQEYVVWRVFDREVDWFVLHNGQYERLALSPDGFYRSEVFPGLRLDPAALIAGNIPGIFQVVQQGVASPEHAAFVAQLGQAVSSRPPA